MNIVFNYDFTTAVLQECFPSCSDLVRLFRNFKWGRGYEVRGTHIYVVKRQESKEAKDSHCITTRNDYMTFAQAELPNLYIIYFQNFNLTSSWKLVGIPKHLFSPIFYRQRLHLWTAFLVARYPTGRIIKERKPNTSMTKIAINRNMG